MQSGTQAAAISRANPWAGRIVIGLPVLFMLVDGTMKLFRPTPVVETMTELGFSERLTVGVGVLALACIAMLLYPRTSVLGAVLLTGYLGGAVASNARIEAGLFSIIFPVIIAALVWGGLYLRDERVRSLIAPRC